MHVLLHHIYEYNKGLRCLILHTLHMRFKDKATRILHRKGLCYTIQDVNPHKVNIFFGKEQCIRIVESFGNKNLSELSDEEDFMLGIMLGYDRSGQYSRYLKRKNMPLSLSV